MKNLVIIAIIIVAAVTPAHAQRQFVAFENVEPEYKSLADVRPIVANRGRQSIYLWPQECGEALLSWLQQDCYWYDSDRKPCPQMTQPIEIKPDDTFEVAPLVIRMEFGDDDFYENRVGRPGKFRITMSYSFQPVYRVGPPLMKELISRGFTVVP